LSCWEVCVCRLCNFVPKYVPENPKNTDQNDASNGGAVRCEVLRPPVFFG
jgi:hypothetical protein